MSAVASEDEVLATMRAALARYRKVKDLILLWEVGVKFEQSDDADYQRGIGRGFMLAAVNLGYDPQEDGWRKDPQTGRWER